MKYLLNWRPFELISILLLAVSACTEKPKSRLGNIVDACKKDPELNCSDKVYKLRSENSAQALKDLSVLCDLNIFVACGYLAYSRPVRGIEFWRNFFKIEKLTSWKVEALPPPDLLEAIGLLNRANGNTSKLEPGPATLSPNKLSELQAVVDKMKFRFFPYLKDSIISIFYIKNLGSSGLLFPILNSTEKRTQYVIALDENRSNMSANNWITSRERTAFLNHATQINIVIEDSSENNSKGTIEFLLLHELGHALAHQLMHLPVTDGYASFPEDNYDCDFLKTFWSKTEMGYIPKIGSDFPERKGIKFYREDNMGLPEAAVVDIYTHLKSSGFPTLYASISPSEDFADSFSSYYHSVVLKKPYTISIKTKTGQLIEIDSCWKSGLCEKRKTYFENFLIHFK